MHSPAANEVMVKGFGEGRMERWEQEEEDGGQQEQPGQQPGLWESSEGRSCMVLWKWKDAA